MAIGRSKVQRRVAPQVLGLDCGAMAQDLLCRVQVARCSGAMQLPGPQQNLRLERLYKGESPTRLDWPQTWLAGRRERLGSGVQGPTSAPLCLRPEIEAGGCTNRRAWRACAVQQPSCPVAAEASGGRPHRRPRRRLHPRPSGRCSAAACGFCCPLRYWQRRREHSGRRSGSCDENQSAPGAA